jgi:hypothetical protein
MSFLGKVWNSTSKMTSKMWDSTKNFFSGGRVRSTTTPTGSAPLTPTESTSMAERSTFSTLPAYETLLEELNDIRHPKMPKCPTDVRSFENDVRNALARKSITDVEASALFKTLYKQLSYEETFTDDGSLWTPGGKALYDGLPKAQSEEGVQAVFDGAERFAYDPIDASKTDFILFDELTTIRKACERIVREHGWGNKFHS